MISHTAQIIILRYSLALLSIFALLGASTVRGDDILPSYSDYNRYSAMVDHSPFAVATAVVLPAAFAKDLYLTNAARSPEGDMATIASSSDRNFKKYLTTREPVDGYHLVSVEWSDRVGTTKVTISKDGQFGTLTFNEALLSQRTAPNVPPAPAQITKGMPLAQSMPQLPPSAALQAPAKVLRKPGAPPVASRQQLLEQNERKEQQRRKRAGVGRP